ncbi:uncharacterized protein F4822DRAFT_45496 [Hypoxylon trugodes]|uniref:uncharacterized protein n=1 Tax=Hypoxylon trugodes TaxID=326681 RepID=UPI0021A1D45A|nr:uncharacterized protein F4822DRAFT_45496 [Hypoxylon trugodes]KAI1394344.1 hypothetical protein F4822DRAFT_45496 [Hypoxylon trugodes]
MDPDHGILDKCQFGECEATILIKAPYCAKHTQGKVLSKLTKITAPPSASGQRHPNNCRYPQQNSSLLNGNLAEMTTNDEKLGDAITVKPPLAPPNPSAEKRQLPSKGVARKTTSGTSSKSKQSPTASRYTDINPPLGRDSIGNTSMPDERLLKRPRLSSDENRVQVRAVRQHVPSTGARPHISPVPFAGTTEELNLEPAGPSDFALRPKKENSASLETMPRINIQGTHGIPAPRSPRDDLLRKEQAPIIAKKPIFPTNGIIDLTMSDDDNRAEPPRKSQETLSPSIESDRINQPSRVAEAHLNALNATRMVSEMRREGAGSIELQTQSGQARNLPAGQVDPLVRNGQHPIPKIGLNSSTRHIPKKPHLDIAPRPAGMPLHPRKPQGPLPSQIGLDERENRAPRIPKSRARKPAADIPRQSSERVRSPSTNLSFAKMDKGPISTSNHPSPAPGITRPTPRLDTSIGIGARDESWSASSSRTLDQVRGIIEGSIPPKTRSASNSSQAARPHAPSPRPSRLGTEERIVAPINQPCTTQITYTPEAQTAVRNSLMQGHLTTLEATNTSMNLHKDVETTSRPKELADIPTGKSTLASILRDPNHTRLGLEERRRLLIAKHDPDKFDSYIYGKMNEPFHPGSPLFGLPDSLLPPRPTRPATHFAHIDPRIHWNHARSEKWHRDKQDEICARGNRKDKFGQAVTRAAKRKRDEAEVALRVDLPERVKNNPEWMAALDELDQMAEPYYAQERKKLKESPVQGAKPQQKKKGLIIAVDENGNENKVGQEFTLIGGFFRSS